MSYYADPLSVILLRELGEDLGVPLAFDEHGQCLLVLDDNLMISVHQQSEQSWVLYGMLGEFWQPDNAFFIMLFALNRQLTEQGQGTLIFSKENNSVLYMQHLSLQGASRTSLYQQLEQFTDWLENLINTLNDSAAGKARMQSAPFSPQP
ncbi:MAG: chaperone SicP [Enterobacteriaceae bacterium]